jgi:DNA-binding MarR family transcriptional regulator
MMPARYGAGRSGTGRDAAAAQAAAGEPAADPAAVQDAESAELAARLRTVIQHLMPLLRAQSVHGDLTPSRLAALAALADGGPLRISELAARMGIALSTASRMVDLLDGLGWIERQPDPADLRATLISLADAGGALLRSVRTEHTGILAAEIARLPPGRMRQLHDALPALEALAERASRRPGPPGQHPR